MRFRSTGLLLSLACVAVLALLCACAYPPKTAQQFIAGYGIENPQPSGFKLCYMHDCTCSAQVSLSPAQWDRVRRIFEPPSTDAAMERARVIQAIALLEQMVGKMTGTDRDIGGSFRGSFLPGQMDCIDEAINTSTYLTMMEAQGLLKYHDFFEPAHRGYIINGWPHFATVMVEKATDTKYVIDSWFLDNGEDPYILPIKKWKSGWRPR